MLVRNPFVERRKQLKEKLLAMIEANKDVPRKQIIALFCFRTGLREKTALKYYRELLEAGIIKPQIQTTESKETPPILRQQPTEPLPKNEQRNDNKENDIKEEMNEFVETSKLLLSNKEIYHELIETALKDYSIINDSKRLGQFVEKYKKAGIRVGIIQIRNYLKVLLNYKNEAEEVKEDIEKFKEKINKKKGKDDSKDSENSD